MKRYLKKMITCVMVMVMVVTMTGSLQAGSIQFSGRYDIFRYTGTLSLSSSAGSAGLTITSIDSSGQLLPEESYSVRISGNVVNDDDTLIGYIYASGNLSCSWGATLTNSNPVSASCYYYINEIQVANRSVGVN